MFKGFRPTLGYGFGFCLSSRRFLERKQHIRENQKYQRKPNKNFGKTKKTKFLKVSDPPLDMGLVLFGLLVFPTVFRKPKKRSGKPKIQKNTKENPKNLRENQRNNVLKVSEPSLDMGLFLFVVFVFSLKQQKKKNVCSFCFP